MPASSCGGGNGGQDGGGGLWAANGASKRGSGTEAAVTAWQGGVPRCRLGPSERGLSPWPKAPLLGITRGSSSGSGCVWDRSGGHASSSLLTVGPGLCPLHWALVDASRRQVVSFSLTWGGSGCPSSKTLARALRGHAPPQALPVPLAGQP